MSKVVKKVAPIVGAVVGAFVGFATGGPAGAIRGAALGYTLGKAIQGKPTPNNPVGDPSVPDTGQLATAIGEKAWVPKSYGNRRGGCVLVATDVMNETSSGSDLFRIVANNAAGSYSTSVYVLGEGPWEKITNVYYNNNAIFKSTADLQFGTVYSYGNDVYDTTQNFKNLQFEFIRGNSIQSRSTLLSRVYNNDYTPWFNTTDVGNGICYMVLRVKRDAQAIIRETAPALTIDGYAKRIPEIRIEGSPVQYSNATYQTGTNPALIALDQLRDEKFGLGVQDEDIDFDTFVKFANYCDNPGTYSDGTTIPSFRMHGQFNQGVSTKEILEQIALCTGALFSDENGIITVKIDKQEMAETAPAISADNIVGSITRIESTVSSSPNAINVRFYNEIGIAVTDVVEFNADLIEAEGRKEAELELRMVQDPALARELAKRVLYQSRQPTLEFKMDNTGYNIDVYNVARIADILDTNIVPETTETTRIRIMNVVKERAGIEPNNAPITVSAKIYNDQIYSVNPGSGTDINVIPSTYKISDSGGIGNIPAPSNVYAQAVTDGEISVSWSHLVQYTAQILYRINGSSAEFTQLTTSNSSPTSINLLASGTYDIAVRYLATDLNLGPGPLTVILYTNGGLNLPKVPINGIEYNDDGFVSSQNRYLQMRFADNASGDGIRTSLISQTEIQKGLHSTASTSHPSVMDVNSAAGYTQSVSIKIPGNFNAGTPTPEYHTFNVIGSKPNLRQVLDPGGAHTFNIVIPKTSFTPAENYLNLVKELPYTLGTFSGVANNGTLYYRLIYITNSNASVNTIASVQITSNITTENLISNLINDYNAKKIAGTLPVGIPDFSLFNDLINGKIVIQYNNHTSDYSLDTLYINRLGNVIGDTLIFPSYQTSSGNSYTSQVYVPSTTAGIQYIIPTITSTSVSSGIASSGGDVLVGGTQIILYSKVSGSYFSTDSNGFLVKNSPIKSELKLLELTNNQPRLSEGGYGFSVPGYLIHNGDYYNDQINLNRHRSIVFGTGVNSITISPTFNEIKQLWDNTNYDFYLAVDDDYVTDLNRIIDICKARYPWGGKLDPKERIAAAYGTGFYSDILVNDILPLTDLPGATTPAKTLINNYVTSYVNNTVLLSGGTTGMRFWGKRFGEDKMYLFRIGTGWYSAISPYPIIYSNDFRDISERNAYTNEYWEFYPEHVAPTYDSIRVRDPVNIPSHQSRYNIQTQAKSEYRALWQFFSVKNQLRYSTSTAAEYSNKYFDIKLIQDLNDPTGNSLNNILTRMVTEANAASVAGKGLNNSHPVFELSTVPADATGALAPYANRVAIKITGGSEQFDVDWINTPGSGNLAFENNGTSIYYKLPNTELSESKLTLTVNNSLLTNKSFNNLYNFNLPYGLGAYPLALIIEDRIKRYVSNKCLTTIVTNPNNFTIIVSTVDNDSINGSVSITTGIDANLAITSNNATSVPVYSGLPTIYTITDPTNTYTKTFEDFIISSSDNRLSYTVNQIVDWVNNTVPNYDATWTATNSTSGTLNIFSSTITDAGNNWKIRVNNSISSTNLGYGNFSFNGENTLTGTQGINDYLSIISANVKYIKKFTFNSLPGLFVDKTLPTNLTKIFTAETNQPSAETQIDSFFSTNSITVTKTKYTGLNRMVIKFPESLGLGTNVIFTEINTSIAPKFITAGTYYNESGLTDGIVPTSAKGSVTYGDKVFWAKINNNDYYLWNRFNAGNGGWIIASENTDLDWYYWRSSSGSQIVLDITTLSTFYKVTGGTRASLLTSNNITTIVLNGNSVYSFTSDIIINYNFGIQDNITTNFVWYNNNNASGDYITSFVNKGYIGTVLNGGNQVAGPIKNRITLRYSNDNIIYQHDYWNFLQTIPGHTNKTLVGILADITAKLNTLTWTTSDNGTEYTITVPQAGVNVPLLTGKLKWTIETINPSTGTIIASTDPNNITLSSPFVSVQEGGSLATYYGVRSQSSNSFINSDVQTNFLWFRIPGMTWTTGQTAPTNTATSATVTLLIPTYKLYTKSIPDFQFLNTYPYPTGYNLIEQTNFVIDTDDLTLDQTSLIPTVNLGKATSTLTGSVSVYQYSQNRFLIAKPVYALTQIPINANALNGNTIYIANDTTITATGRTVVNLSDSSTNYEPGRFYLYTSVNTTWTEIQ